MEERFTQLSPERVSRSIVRRATKELLKGDMIRITCTSLPSGGVSNLFQVEISAVCRIAYEPPVQGVR